MLMIAADIETAIFPRARLVRIREFALDHAHAWIAFLPPGLARGDSLESPIASTLRVFEDDRELGPAHVTHDEIRNQGLGRFSHWGNALYLSTSDNTPPAKNGRLYQALIPPDLPDPRIQLLLASATLDLNGMSPEQRYELGNRIVAALAPEVRLSVYNRRLVGITEFVHDSGHGWVGMLPPGLATGDSPDSPIASSLRLFEGDRELGPAHTGHDEIRRHGGGRFSHRGDTVYMSTSDSTSPTENGRIYWAFMSTESLRGHLAPLPARDPVHIEGRRSLRGLARRIRRMGAVLVRQLRVSGPEIHRPVPTASDALSPVTPAARIEQIFGVPAARYISDDVWRIPAGQDHAFVAWLYDRFDMGSMHFAGELTEDHLRRYLAYKSHHPRYREIVDIKRFSMLHEDVLLLLRLFAVAAEGGILEIGPYIGGSTVAIGSVVKALNRGPFVSVEIGGRHPEHPHLPSDDIFQDLQANISKAGLTNHVELINAASYDESALTRIRQVLGAKGISLFFIDADGHIERDLSLYQSLFRPGCVVAFDDYTSSAEEKQTLVMAAVDAAVARGVLTPLGVFGWGTWFGRYGGA